MIDIVIYYPYLDGTTTSLIDLWFNLKHFTNDVRCSIVVDTNDMKRNIDFFVALQKSVPKTFEYRIIPLSDLYQMKFDKLVLSFGIFRFLHKIPTNYNYLYMLDAGRIIYDFFVNDCTYINYMKSLVNYNYTIYTNYTNTQYIQGLNYKIYYHKFSHERINYLKKLNKIHKTTKVEDREKTGNIHFEYLKNDVLNYHRWRKVIDGVYAENIGKMIFEFSALGKQVHYSNENKTQDDGLTCYLKLFGIDDNKNQDIHITEEELFDKLGMKKNDVLLNDITQN